MPESSSGLTRLFAICCISIMLFTGVTSIAEAATVSSNFPEFTLDSHQPMTAGTLTSSYEEGSAFFVDNSFTASTLQMSMCHTNSSSTGYENVDMYVYGPYVTPTDFTPSDTPLNATPIWFNTNECLGDYAQILTGTSNSFDPLTEMSFESGKWYVVAHAVTADAPEIQDIVIGTTLYGLNYNTESCTSSLFCGASQSVISVVVQETPYLNFTNTGTLTVTTDTCGLFHLDICMENAFEWAFVPSTESWAQFQSLSLASSSPFGYIYDFPATLTSLFSGSSTSSPAGISIDLTDMQSVFQTLEVEHGGAPQNLGTTTANVFNVCMADTFFSGHHYYADNVMPFLRAALWLGFLGSLYLIAHRIF